jgi:hypothetical protein
MTTACYSPAFFRRDAALPSCAAALPPPPDEIPHYYAMRWPVTLVTDALGREDYDDSRALFGRLAELGREGRPLMQVTEAGVSLTPESLATLNYFLRRPDWTIMLHRVARTRRGPERARYTKWQWEYLPEFLQLAWRPPDA